MKNIKIEYKSNIAYVTLNRPKIHNALDENTISELTQALDEIEANLSIRALVVKAEGENFCSGKDIEYLKLTVNNTVEENTKDTANLASMLYTLYSMNIPTIALVQGKIFGVGVGIVSACDIVIADENSTFAINDVCNGQIPAVISPYVVRAVGGRHMKRYAQTAEVFTAKKAEKIGIVHELANNSSHANALLEDILKSIVCNAPQATSLAKQLAEVVGEASLDDNTLLGTAEWVANRRATDEGIEGIASIIENRKPNWMK